MKKNVLVTTGLTNAWNFSEKNFILGSWCEFYKTNILNENGFKKKILKEDVIKNSYHWNDSEKKFKDYEYLKEKIEYSLEIISDKLSLVHEVKENKEYWRVVIFIWLNHYVSTIFDRYEIVKTFFEKNKGKKFISYELLLNELDFIPNNHPEFVTTSTRDDNWNHMIFLRLFYFFNYENLLLIKKENEKQLKKKDFSTIKQNFPLKIRVIKFIDQNLSKIAFKFNQIIFDSFYFPKKEFLKICLRCKLIPSKYSNFFDFNINEDNIITSDKRSKFENLLKNFKNEDKFIQFLFSNIHKDIPKSYLENFDVIKKKILPYARRKKIIFSMHSIFYNDNFKLYIAETKKIGSKFIFSVHGSGLPLAIYPHFDYFEKISDKIITWDNTIEKKNIYEKLSPTLPLVKVNNLNNGQDCSIIFLEYLRYAFHSSVPIMELSIDWFNEIVKFVNALNPEIRSKIKFRSKGNFSHDSEKNFSRIFGEKTISKISFENPISKTIMNSKLIICTYPQTVFSQAMHSNVPTILIVKKNHFYFSKIALDTLDDLKKNHIFFDNFDDLQIHINKYWKDLNSWWMKENVQLAREKFLKNFFHIKSDWCKEWSDYINSSRNL